MGTECVITMGTEADVSSLSLELLEENHKLSRTLESFQMSIDSFEADPKRLQFYTGLDSIHAFNWASEASPTLGCSIEISCDICDRIWEKGPYRAF